MEFTRKELYFLLNSPKPLWLVGADLSKAVLNRADLSGATLFGTSLAGAKLLDEASLRGAVMPDGSKHP
jgi:uncharacterized protein YjbI with pentapeptide repeats